MPAQAINISKDQLIKLYLVKKLSTDDIGKIFHCNHVTVLNYLKKYQIPRRSKLGNRNPVNIPKKVLSNLYLKQKLTPKQIAEKFGHSRYGIFRWIKKYGIKTRSYSETNTKYPKFDFKGNLKEKAYLIGFRLGDLNVYQRHELVQVRCSTTIKNQITLIEKLFKKYGNVHVWTAKRGTYECIILLNKSFSFLLPKNDRIEKWILSNRNLVLSFLAGYADAEGSYYLRKPYYKTGKTSWGVFEIQTNDKNIIQTLSLFLNKTDIYNKFTISKKGGFVDKRGIKCNKDVWRFTITKKLALWNFIKLIGPYHRHKSKRKDLEIVKKNLIQRNSLPYCRPIKLS